MLNCMMIWRNFMQKKNKDLKIKINTLLKKNSNIFQENKTLKKENDDLKKLKDDIVCNHSDLKRN